MKIRSIKYHLKQGVKGVFKNGLMSFASIASVIVCAFMFIVSLCVAINLDSALEKLEKGVGISIFLAEEISDEEAQELLHLIEKIPNIALIEYTSKEEALDWAKEEWGDEQAILSGLENDNPFPRSFELTLDGAKYQKQVIQELEKLRYDFEKKLIDKRTEDASKINEILKNSNSQIENKNEPSSENTNNNYTEEKELNIGNKGYQYIGIEKIKHSQRQADILLKVSQSKKDLEETKEEKSSFLKEVEKLDTQLEKTEDELKDLQNKLENTKKTLEKTEIELKEALKKKIRIIYEYGSETYLDILLDSKGVMDFFKRIEYVNRIMKKKLPKKI